MQPCKTNPHLRSLWFPSACHSAFGPGTEYTLLTINPLLRIAVPFKYRQFMIKPRPIFTLTLFTYLMDQSCVLLLEFSLLMLMFNECSIPLTKRAPHDSPVSFLILSILYKSKVMITVHLFSQNTYTSSSSSSLTL